MSGINGEFICVNKVVLDNTIEVGKLEYGTIIMGVKGCPESIYMKVNKRKLGVGIDLRIDDRMDNRRKYSILLNLEYGTLRMVLWDTKVVVCEPKFTVTEIVDRSAIKEKLKTENCF